MPHHQGFGTPSIPGTLGTPSIPQHLGSLQAGALPGCRDKIRSGCGTSSSCTDVSGLPLLPALAGRMLCQLSLAEQGPPGLQRPLADPGLMAGAAPSSLGTLVLGTESLPCALRLCEVSAPIPCTDAGNCCWEYSPRLRRAQEQWVRAVASAPVRNRDSEAVNKELQ